MLNHFKNAVQKAAGKLGYEIRRKPADRPLQPSTDLTEIEKDFIEFVCLKRNRPESQIRQIYLETRHRFKFKERSYFDFCENIHYLFRLFYNDLDEEGLFESYRFYALPHTFYFLGEWSPQTDRVAAEFMSLLKGRLVSVVDYGCGLSPLSFAAAKFPECRQVYLVDIENLKLEFSEFRFRKHGKNAAVIKVSRENPYPALPPHNLCIATEVMEHLTEPLRAYENIYASMEKGGILYGYFGDHEKILYHISADLEPLRRRLSRDFEKIGDLIYRKR